MIHSPSIHYLKGGYFWAGITAHNYKT